ncbi:MAG: TonB-dependent receptor [Robiginitomaculum sp.]|nr:MAG: TonB-dependent receptor [Robiginitomaculum sp.]
MTYKTTLMSAVSISFIALVTPQLSLAQASENTSDHDTIIVTGTRLNQTAAEAGTSISIITAEDIESLGFELALDAVASAPGVTINQNGSFGGAASVRIRGMSSGQTLVLVDGVPVGDPSTTNGSFDFARLDAADIERIEVLKGPQSTLWGSDAIGGVISIITKAPQSGKSGKVFAEFGSFNTLRAGASFEYGGDNGDFRLSANTTSTDGISKADAENGNTEDDGYKSLNISARGGYNFTPSARLDASISYTDANTDFDSYSFGAQGSVADGDAQALTEELSGHAKLAFSLFSDMLENEIFLGYSNTQRENLTNGNTSYEAEGERFLYRYQGTATLNESNTFAFGLEREEAYSGSLDRVIDSVFGLYEWKPVENFTLTAGIRLDDHEDFGSQTTPRLAAAYTLTPQANFRASWGQGFKAPSVFQSTYICGFCGLTEPNRNLKPEEATGFDFGVDLYTKNERGSLSLTWFDQDVTNQINFSFTAGYDNIEQVNSQGLEVSASYQFTDWLGLSTDYTYIDSKDGTGAELARIPKHSGDVSLSISPNGPLSGAVLVRYNGEEQNTNGTQLDSWTRIDLNAAYEFSETVELYGRVENLFDTQYQQVLGYGTPGLSGTIGIRLQY